MEGTLFGAIWLAHKSRGGRIGFVKIYGKVAVAAARECIREGKAPDDAWKEVFAHELCTEWTRRKGCPRSTFLYLCAIGMIKGIPPKGVSRRSLNGGYGVDAIGLLRVDPELAKNRKKLWSQIPGKPKKQNGQLEVVISLIEADLIEGFAKP